MRIGVTGAGGYVGRHLARSLASAGHEVVALSRASGFRLGEPVPAGALAGLDALVHSAYDFTAADPAANDRVNVRGSVSLFDAAASAGVGRLVFVSSMAAYDGCRSVYGRGKRRVEDAALGRGGVVVRPGTVYGGEAGGLFRSLTRLVALFPVVPLPGRGDQPLSLVHVDDLCDAVATLLAVDLPAGDRVISAASAERVTLRAVLERIAAGLGKRRVFVPVPAPLMLGGLRGAEAVLGRRMPVRSDSLVSLLNANPDPDFRLPPALSGLTFRPYL